MPKKSNASPNQSNVNEALNSYTMAATDAEESLLDMLLLNLNKQYSTQLATEESLHKVKSKLMKDRYEAELKMAEELGGTEEEIAQRKASIEQRLMQETVELAQKMEENKYKFATKKEKIKIKESQKLTLEKTKSEIQQKMALQAIELSHGNHNNKVYKDLSRERKKVMAAEIAGEQVKRKLTVASLKEQKKYGSVKLGDLEASFNAINESFEAEKQGHLDNIDYYNEEIEYLKKKKEEAIENGSDGSQFDALINEAEDNKKEAKKEYKKADKERFGNQLLQNTMTAGFKGIQSGLSKLGDSFDAAMDNAIETVGQFKSSIDAGLQGSQSSYDSVAKTLKQSLAVSPYVKQTEVLKKLNDAVEKGIAYNVEQRAFLGTMTDKIVHTFDALDDTLMRMIRLQQADTTAARMGMEAQLLQFFNSTFSDSSYLTSGYDQVSQALVDANAQMTRDMSIAFEYNVQKWMGALASLGFGTDTIQTIAQGVNYLGSGNVQALAGNTQLQSLLAMSASRAGLPYSELLVKGIDDSSVNELLKAMVEYLAEIAEDNNAVVKAAYGDVFNFTQADLRAIKNIANDGGATISNIYNASMDYSKAMTEIQSQLNQVGDRLSMNEMVDNVFDNFLYTSGETLASNPATAILWRTIKTIEEITGGIEIPFINVYGFGLDLNMSIERLMRAGMFGLSAISNVGNMITSISNGGGMNLDIWGGTEYTRRGGEFNSTVGGVQSTKSGSTSYTSGSESDTKKAALDGTKEDQEEQKKSSKESMSEEITVETFYNEIFETKTPVYTMDIPVFAKTMAIASAVEATQLSVNRIYELLNDKVLSVQVTNMPTIPIIPSSMSIDTNSLTSISKSLSTAVADALTKPSEGTDTKQHTIADLVELLAYGVIRVEDVEVGNKLNIINANLI